MYNLNDNEDEKDKRFTYKETFAMILAAYRVMLPKLLVPVAALLILSVIAKLVFKY